MNNIKYAHYINEFCFRDYDIRGIVGENLFFQDAFYIGKALATYIINNSDNHRICVGCDGRLSSPILEKNLIDGIKSCGVDVISIGICPTPMLYFATHTTDTPHGIMITGSHNPMDYNGFKIVINRKPLFAKNLKKLYDIIANASYKISKNNAIKIVDLKVSENYITNLANSLNFFRKSLKVAWDASNGSGAEVINNLIEKLPGKHFVINNYIDGNFPSHDPDPTIEKNLTQLIELVVKEKCDLGLAFDGDADRLVAVDNTGRMIQGDILITILAEEILKKYKSPIIIADIKASKVFIDYINNKGGMALIWKTGHSNIKEKMQEVGAVLAGEVSGHIFFADRYYGFDDGIYAAIRLLEIVSNNDISLAQLIDKLPKTEITPEIRIDCEEDRKFIVIEEIKQRLIQSNARFMDIDGIRCETEDGWWLIRASNTQASLVLRMESDTVDGLRKLQIEVKNHLETSNITII